MKPRLHFIYRMGRNVAVCVLCFSLVFFLWNWLHTKIRRNSEEIQLASLVNHTWCCDQERWQDLNFGKQVWRPWQMRRQIIVMIQGALRGWFHYWLVLEDTSSSNQVAHVLLLLQPFSHLCAKCRAALRAPWSVNAKTSWTTSHLLSDICVFAASNRVTENVRLFSRNRILPNLRFLSFLQGYWYFVSLKEKHYNIFSSLNISPLHFGLVWWGFFVCSHAVPKIMFFEQSQSSEIKSVQFCYIGI